MSHLQLLWPGARPAWTGTEPRGNKTHLPRHPGHLVLWCQKGKKKRHQARGRERWFFLLQATLRLKKLSSLPAPVPKNFPSCRDDMTSPPFQEPRGILISPEASGKGWLWALSLHLWPRGTAGGRNRKTLSSLQLL